MTSALVSKQFFDNSLPSPSFETGIILNLAKSYSNTARTHLVSVFLICCERKMTSKPFARTTMNVPKIFLQHHFGILDVRSEHQRLFDWRCGVSHGMAMKDRFALASTSSSEGPLDGQWVAPEKLQQDESYSGLLRGITNSVPYRSVGSNPISSKNTIFCVSNALPSLQSVKAISFYVTHYAHLEIWGFPLAFTFFRAILLVVFVR